MEESWRIYETILAQGPSRETILIILSRMKKEGLLAKVIQESIRALATHPEDIQIRRLLAETYLESGLLSQAEREFEGAALQLDAFSSIYKRLGEIYGRQGREDEALRALNVYLAHEPEDEEAMERRDSLERIRTDKALEQVSEETLDSTEEIEETSPEIATPKLAEIYFAQGLIQEAAETYEKVVNQNPSDGASIDRLAELKEMLSAEKAVDDRRRLRVKKEELIGVLEEWLTRLQKRLSPPVTH
jgi:tetratricopeptide (TPR) repeat protein